MRPTSDLSYGTMHERDGRTVLRFERRLAQPVDRVWTALTDPAELIRWWGSADELNLVEGGRLVLRWLNEGENGERFVMSGRVTRLDPPRLVEYDTDLHGVLRFELREDGDATVLVFSSTVADCPPDERPKMLAGWHMHLDFLADALAGQRADLANLPMDRWATWRDEYAAQLS